MKVIPCLLAAVMSLVFCPSPVTSQVATIPTTSSVDFPLSVGNKWVYAVYDSLRSTRDTVSVVIDAELARPDGTTSYLWLRRFRTHDDTIYVDVRDDTVRFRPSGPASYDGISELRLPLTIGEGWTVYDEAATVADQESVVVPAGTFPMAFRVVQQGICCNDYSHYQWWIKPQIEIVKAIHSTFISVDLSSRTLTEWALLSFSALTTGIGGAVPSLPGEYSLAQNFPNPFNPSTTFRYGLPVRSSVTITVFNELGQKVADLVNSVQAAGFHDVRLDGSDLASGVYFCRLFAVPFAGTDIVFPEGKQATRSYVQTRKLLLVK